MGWASHYIQKLKNGETVSFRPRGNSMSPKIESGQLVTVAPITTTPNVGDIVLCVVSGKQYLHLISAKNKTVCQISNNKGYINGWTKFTNIFGKVIKIE